MPSYSFYADKKLIEQIDARSDNRSEAISRDLENYYTLLADARRSLKRTLTDQELYLLCERAGDRENLAGRDEHLSGLDAFVRAVVLVRDEGV